MGIYMFGNNTYPRRIRHRSNLGHVFQGKKCVLWAGKYGNTKGRENVAVKQLTFLLHILEVVSSNFGLKTGYFFICAA
jgi:hypothetical protein